MTGPWEAAELWGRELLLNLAKEAWRASVKVITRPMVKAQTAWTNERNSTMIPEYKAGGPANE